MLPTMQLVGSSMLDSVGYDEDSQVLYVRFRSGAVWAYDSVPPEEFDTLMSAPSKGSYFLQNIRGAYNDRKVG